MASLFLMSSNADRFRDPR